MTTQKNAIEKAIDALAIAKEDYNSALFVKRKQHDRKRDNKSICKELDKKSKVVVDAIEALRAAQRVDVQALKKERVSALNNGLVEFSYNSGWNDCIDHLAATGRLAGQGWQPIENCPTDGTIVLLAWPNSLKRYGAVSAKLPDWNMEVREYCIHGSGGARSYHGQATHWMPLPQPPALDKGE